jgi:HSP20 family protein
MLRDVARDVLPGLGRGDGWIPDADVIALDGRHLVILDLPGVPRDAVRVRLEGARLVVQGERAAVHHEGGAVRSGERPYGPFKREFLLPPDVDGAGVTASLDDGVLRVIVPRRGSGDDRDIPVEGGAGTVDGDDAS